MHLTTETKPCWRHLTSMLDWDHIVSYRRGDEFGQVTVETMQEQLNAHITCHDGRSSMGRLHDYRALADWVLLTWSLKLNLHGVSQKLN